MAPTIVNGIPVAIVLTLVKVLGAEFDWYRGGLHHVSYKSLIVCHELIALFMPRGAV